MSATDPPGWEAAYEAGDPVFVDAIRRVHDPEVLARLAERWSCDDRLAARGWIRSYFDRPLNAFRHEILVKRLFKAAERTGDDEALAWMMPALDRSIERRVQLSRRTESAVVATREEARELARLWARGGDRVTRTWQIGPDQHVVVARGREPGLAVPHGTRMPGDALRMTWVLDPHHRRYKRTAVPEWLIRVGGVDPVSRDGNGADPSGRLERLARYRLFSVATRHHLRRRLWRYFRGVAQIDAGRYVRAMARSLVLYRDADVDGILPLLDRWCLVHALFGDHPALEPRSNGWVTYQEMPEEDLEPHPAFAHHWANATEQLVSIARDARSRLVRAWAVRLLERQPHRSAAVLDFDGVQNLATHRDAAVAKFGAACLSALPDQQAIDMGRWRRLISDVNNEVESTVADVIERQIEGVTLGLDQAVELTLMRPEPLAGRGFASLRERSIDDDQLSRIVQIAHAPCAQVRVEVLAWLRERLAGSPRFQTHWVCDWLESDQAETRAWGLEWFHVDERVRSDRGVWERVVRRLTPETCAGLVGVLATVAPGSDGSRMDLVAILPLSTLLPLWAYALESEPAASKRVAARVIEQLRRRSEREPGASSSFLPLLARAARSVSPRVASAAVAGLARLRVLRPDLGSAIADAVPELQWVT
jgi:hypothetical protein